jgi:DNA-nicking Smr family endonuclease
MAKRDPKRQPALADWHLWTEVTRSISPLRQRRTLLEFAGDGPLPLPDATPPRPKPDKKLAMQPFLPSYQADGRSGKAHTEPGRIIEPKLRRKLTRGRIEIDGTLDLHGMRQAEARLALNRYIMARHARGDRTILVITGKGLKKIDNDAARIVEKGILRAMLPIWLSEPGLAPLIAGWDSAAQGHGGEGAFYVRLRRGDK